MCRVSSLAFYDMPMMAAIKTHKRYKELLLQGMKNQNAKAKK